MSCDAYIGLGSNLGDSKHCLEQAFAALDALPETQLTARSRLYRSAPMGPADQPDYINAVAQLHTALEPYDLLDALNVIEAEYGRNRPQETRWGPRTLDLDILMMGDLQMHEQRLTIPHPGAHERIFVLLPWADIAADVDIPGHGTVGYCLERIPLQGIEAVDGA